MKSKTDLSIFELRAKARQLTQELSQLPRAEIVSRFKKLIEEIRQTAIANNMIVDGDWLGD